MARSVRNATLENRTNRLTLPQGTRHWRTIGKGLALGYRRGKNGGTWYLRRESEGNRYTIKSVGIADDYRDADNVEVFNYFQAQERVRERAKQQTLDGVSYTVENAINDYLLWFKANRKSYEATRATCHRHIVPSFGKHLVCDLKTPDIRSWRDELVSSKNLTDPEKIRAAKATANRILTSLKAALNLAFDDDHVASDLAWRKVRPFEKVDIARIRYLSQQESKRLINACAGDFRYLVQAALLTGARYGELTKLDCACYNPDSKTIFIADSKSGKPRYIPLNDEGARFFDRVVAGKLGHETIFVKDDGQPWGKSHQSRPMKEACEVAKIFPPATFHHLRHTYASLLAAENTPLQIISIALGHSDTRITEKHYAHLLPSHIHATIRKNLPSFGIQEDNVFSIGSV